MKTTSYLEIDRIWMELAKRRCAKCDEPAPYFDVIHHKRSCIDTGWIYIDSSPEYTFPLPYREDYGCLPWKEHFRRNPGSMDEQSRRAATHEHEASVSLMKLLRYISSVNLELDCLQHIVYCWMSVWTRRFEHDRAYLTLYAPWPAENSRTETPHLEWETDLICKVCRENFNDNPRRQSKIRYQFETHEALVSHVTTWHRYVREPWWNLIPWGGAVP